MRIFKRKWWIIRIWSTLEIFDPTRSFVENSRNWHFKRKIWTRSCQTSLSCISFKKLAQKLEPNWSLHKSSKLLALTVRPWALFDRKSENFYQNWYDNALNTTITFWNPQLLVYRHHRKVNVRFRIRNRVEDRQNWGCWRKSELICHRTSLDW